MSLGEKVFIVVLPNLNAKTTNFEFDYQLLYSNDNNWATINYNRFFGGEEGQLLSYVAAGCVLCLLCLYITICCCCVRACCKRKDDGQIAPEEINQPSNSPNHRSLELQIESISDHSGRGNNNFGQPNYNLDNTIDAEETIDPMRGGGSTFKVTMDNVSRNKNKNLASDDEW